MGFGSPPRTQVRKPTTGDYRPVQDLREVNKRTINIHPTVPNPYTLLSTLSPEKQWYTVLDLKDAFFSLPLAPKSQELFAFKWTDPERGINGQLTWTQLPQGFKNSPTLFDEALHKDLSEYRQTHLNLTLLQYVDDLLIAAQTLEECTRGTEDLLHTLGSLGYRASAKKAQLCKTEPPTTLNPASLLPDPDLKAPLHNCVKVLAQVHGVREDLRDQPLPNTEVTWFTDGSSFVHQGQRYAGAAVVSETEIMWAEPLPADTSAQKAELIALTQALKLGKGKRLMVYTDSRYAFATAHIHGAIYRKRGLLTAEGKTIKNKKKILALLAALWEPKRLTIVHCLGHQKPIDPVSRGNYFADQTTKKITMAPIQAVVVQQQFPDPGPRNLPPMPEYTEKNLQWVKTLPEAQLLNGWWRDSKCRIILPKKLEKKYYKKSTTALT
ncbi:uncharacterized protein LOC133747014 [Lepus europaeus]|uniref:uncharacterized protein LOC133747014 n=1 Tax=Lepus europaeus TaxID=9983 RepID=UPI002B4684E8|nr:uncharacterized protein LOC133747014 [Lepus europaeus]